MRKSFLDELPQVYNWLKGDMSLVGLRPLHSAYEKLYSPDLVEARRIIGLGIGSVAYVYAKDPVKSERIYIEKCQEPPVTAPFGRYRLVA